MSTGFALLVPVSTATGVDRRCPSDVVHLVAIRVYGLQSMFASKSPPQEFIDSWRDYDNLIRFLPQFQRTSPPTQLEFAVPAHAEFVICDCTIEKRFRTVKGPLLVHPLFVHSDERIEGMVFISLLALLVRALLEQRCRQRGITESIDRLLRKFESLQAIDIRWKDGSCQRQATQMSDFQAHVLHRLGWRMPHAYAHLTQR